MYVPQLYKITNINDFIYKQIQELNHNNYEAAESETIDNLIKSIRFCHGEPYQNFSEFFDYFCVFLQEVRFDRIESINLT